MRINSKDFRVRPGKRVRLGEWPTMVKPFCRSKKGYRKLLEAHTFIRRRLGDLFGEKAAQLQPIQYGGSVKPDNASGFLSQPDVDGALLGGASLETDQFIAIVRAGMGELKIPSIAQSESGAAPIK